jgi:transcriptional regulator with PAS, ATPase and Fis domain
LAPTKNNGSGVLPKKTHSIELRYGSLFEHAPCAIIIAEREGFIVAINEQAETLFGYSRNELIGQSIVASAGGTISVESAVGKGTVFHLIFPSTHEQPIPSPKPELDFAQPVRRGRLLVIDDEAMIGALGKRALTPQHEVIFETDPKAALERLAQGLTFDVILLSYRHCAAS